MKAEHKRITKGYTKERRCIERESDKKVWRKENIIKGYKRCRTRKKIRRKSGEAKYQKCKYNVRMNSSFLCCWC